MKQFHNECPVIVYLGGFSLPDKNASAHRVIANAKIFRMLGYQTKIIGFQGMTDRNIQHIPQREKSIGMIEFATERKNLPLLSSFRFNPASIISYLRRLSKRRKISHVICYNYPSIAQGIIQLYCKRKGIHYITDVTEWNTERTSHYLYSIIRAADVNFRIYFLNRFATGLITTSPYMTNFYHRSRQNISEIPTLFDKKQLETKLKKKDVSDKTIKLIFIGPGFDISIKQPEPRNMKERIDSVLRMVMAALDKGADIHLDVFGITQDQFMNAFPQDASVLEKQAKYIQFHGRVSHERILQGLYESDFSILFRDNKRANNAGFPTKFAESLLTGTPVIMNEIESIKSYYDHPHVLLLEDHSLEKVADQMLNKITKYRQRENHAPSPEISYQTFHYSNYKDEMKKAIEL